MKVTKNGVQNVPIPTPRPKPEELQAPAERERVSRGWSAAVPIPTPNPRRQQEQGGSSSGNTMLPVVPGQLAAATVDAVKGLAPMGVSSVDPLQLLDGVKDGKATIEIPLQPGHYKMKGVGYDVKPGTVARVQVDVKDGRVMPAVDQNGRETGRGTKVEIDPPLDLPLWVTGNGAYVQDKGGAQAAFKAELGGFFDLKIRQLNSTKLPDVVRSLSAANPDAKAGNFPKGMLRTDQTRFDAQVSMKDNVISAGAAKIDLAPGSYVRMNGTAKRAALDGQLNLDGATFKQGGTDVKLGPGSAHVRAEYTALADGTMKLSTNVSGINARIQSATLEHARRPGDTDPDRLQLGTSTITNGSFVMDATLKQQRGSMIPELASSTVRLSGETEGALIGGKISVKDAQGDAELKIGPGRFKGTLDATPQGTKVDGAITNTAVDVKDLQTQNKNARLGIQSGHFEGDLKLRSDTGTGDFDLTMKAKKVDVRIDGYAGKSATHAVDFKRIDVAGSGDININNRTGTQITGDMRVRGELNDLTVGNQLDIGAGSTIDGRATSFHAGGERGFELKGQATLDGTIEKFDVNATGLNASALGGGRLRGNTQFEISKGEVSLVMTKGRADVTLEDAKLGGADRALALDVAKGSKATLQLEEARFGKAADGITTSVKLGKGSVIDATLDEGHVTVAGRRVDLEPGGTARFEFDSLAASTNGGLPALQGSLKLNTGVRAGDLSGLEAGGIKVAQAGNVRGRVQLDVPNVRLSSDGNVSYRNAHVSLDARIGDVRPGTARPAQLSATPAGVLSEDQVKAQSAAQIAGASSVGRPTGYDPMDAARRVQNGTVTVEIPVEGRLGEGYTGSADFAKGTKLKLELRVKDGKVVPSETKASFSKAGDAALWVQARGAYLDKNNTLKIDLAGWPDKTIPGMENLPTDIDALVTRLQSRSASSASVPGGLDAFKFDQAKVGIEGAQFKPGKMSVPGGTIDIGPNTRLSVSGDLKNAVLRGHVDLNGVDIAQSGVALKGSKGSADLSVVWRDGVATTTLDKLNLQTEYAVQKRANGDYVKLAKGNVQNGRITLETPVDVRNLSATRPTNATIDLQRFTGTVEGARLTTVDAAGKKTQLEIGRAQIDGSMRVDPNGIEVKGSVVNADLAARGLSSPGAQIDSARMVGSGTVDFSSRRGLSLSADVQAMDVKAKGTAAGQTAQRSRITGAGHVEWSSTKGLSLEGELHVEADVSGSAQLRGAVPQRQPVRRVTVERGASAPN